MFHFTRSGRNSHRDS